MSRLASGNLNAFSKPVLKNPLRASTMSLHAPAAAVSEEPEGPGYCVAEEEAAEVTGSFRKASTSAANSAWCWNRKPCAESG